MSWCDAQACSYVHTVLVIQYIMIITKAASTLISCYILFSWIKLAYWSVLKTVATSQLVFEHVKNCLTNYELQISSQ